MNSSCYIIQWMHNSNSLTSWTAFPSLSWLFTTFLKDTHRSTIISDKNLLPIKKNVCLMTELTFVFCERGSEWSLQSSRADKWTALWSKPPEEVNRPDWRPACNSEGHSWPQDPHPWISSAQIVLLLPSYVVKSRYFDLKQYQIKRSKIMLSYSEAMWTLS